MLFTKKPYKIDSVYYVDGKLKIGCGCQEYTEALTGGNACFKDCGGRITLTVFSPANNIITIRVNNHRIEPRYKADSVIELVPSGLGSFEDAGDYFSFKSGHLEARINKKVLDIKYYYCGNELCSQNVKMPVFYKSDAGSATCYAVSSNAVSGASFELKVRENIYGLGGAGSTIVRNGQTVKCNVFDGRAGAEHIPFVLSDSKYGIFVNTSHPVTFDIGSDSGNLSFETAGEEIEYSVIAGDTSIQVLEVFSQLNGRIPALSYSNGGISLVLNDDNTLTAQGIIDSLKIAKSAGVNIKELWIGNSWHPDYAPYGFTFDSVRFPDPLGFAKAAADLGVTLGVSINPFISERAPEYPELLDAGLLISFPDGRAVICDDGKGGVAMLDLNIPEARSWLINATTGVARNGISMFESNYTHSISGAFENACGKKGYLTNFTNIMNSALSDVSARERGRLGSFIIADSISSGDQQSPFSNIYCSLTPEFSDLVAALKNTISYGLTGFGGINIDIPEKALTDPKLFDRWVGFAAYVPHSRFKGTLKFLEDAAALDSIKAFSAIRTGLAPYIYSSICESVKYGTPAIRAIALEFAGDPAAEGFDTEYMLGPSLLVSPVISQNDNVRIYIPQGIWTDFMTHEKVQGPRYISRKAGAGSVPVFARPNSIIPTRTAESTGSFGSLDNITFTCFGLTPGATTACEVFSDGAQSSGIITVEVSGNRITVRTQNLGGTKHLILSGIFNVVGLSESVPEKHSFGTSIEFTSNELVISLG